jgi:hypothetical protein
MSAAVLFNRLAKGRIEIKRGVLEKLKAAGGKSAGDSFEFSKSGGRLEISVSGAKVSPGAFQTIIGVMTEDNPFSFNLRDVSSGSPVYIPEFQAAVVPADDPRSYQDIEADISAAGIRGDFARFEDNPEETWESASAKNKKQYCPTWLGVSRDMRIFRFGCQEENGYFGRITPCYHSTAHKIARDSDRQYKIDFVIGHGCSCRMDIKRWLDEGVLPILRAEQREGFMSYQTTAFATLEKHPLSEKNVRGSDWVACYANTGGNMLKAEDREKIQSLLDKEMYDREEELTLLCRIEAVNTGKTPCHAWLKTPYIEKSWQNYSQVYDSAKGFSILKEWDNGVMSVNLLNGAPLAEEETAVLVPPGQKAVFDLIIPHSPVSEKRAEKLAGINFEEHLDACRKFWRKKLASGGKISVPEKHIDNSVGAGLLHCDIAAPGLEPDGPALATIGWYAPIGTESAPIIQFFDSMGWHKLAERCIQFFFERQRPDGFIQNFNNYQSETGPLLWTVGEHFRYTLDRGWLRRVLPNIKKAAGYLLEWRGRNKKEEFRERGLYGMVDGKVADPDDFYHSFFLNAGTYIGLKRTAEICAEIDPAYSKKLSDELKDYIEDIRCGFRYAMARAPLVPAGDGSWAPLMPPWVEYTGGISFFADGGRWFSHGAFASRSCLTGPLWLIYQEVFDAGSLEAGLMLKANQFPVTLDNAALSQPYYCRHDFAHIKRREIKSFLMAYYNQLSGLQDRETFTFWEHYFHASEHKTHEEAWFLMQTRWMLWFEDGGALSLLRAVPRKWLEDGKEIALENVKSYFGALSLKVKSELAKGFITAEIICDPERAPKTVEIRLPHPENRRAVSCSNGKYNPGTESVTLSLKKGRAEVTVKF